MCGASRKNVEKRCDERADERDIFDERSVLLFFEFWIFFCFLRIALFLSFVFCGVLDARARARHRRKKTRGGSRRMCVCACVCVRVGNIMYVCVCASIFSK